MYRSFYGLKEKPFSLLPDPAFLFLSPQHEMAISLLDYSLENQAGFCVVTGKAGTGKTILLRRLLNRIGDDVSVGLITNTHHSFGELLRWILHAFNLDDSGGSRARLHQVFIDYLIAQYARNRRTMLIVDEAQNMSVAALEELRMLSNINSEKDLLLQVVLVGQPPLRDILCRPELEQFAQRVAVDYHIEPLNAAETRGYIRHRLQVAGGECELFTDDACEAVHVRSSGIPRLINLLCDLALVYGYAGREAVITAELIEQIISEREQYGALPVFAVATETGATQYLSQMNAQASVAMQGHRAALSRRTGDTLNLPVTPEKTAVPRPKPDHTGRAHVHAVKTTRIEEKPEVAVVVEPEVSQTEPILAVSQKLAASEPHESAPALFARPDSMPGHRSQEGKPASRGASFTYGPARRTFAEKPVRAWRFVTAAAAVFAFSIIALGWYYFDRTGMLNAAFSKTPPAFIVTTPSSAPKPASAPAQAMPPVADASASQNTVAASPVSNHDKSAAEDVRLKQAQHEHDVVLATVEAAELERESLRRAIKAQQYDLMMQHEAALARERERANQLARAAELAILQAQSAEKVVETKQAESALPPPETPKKE
jgi:type II secretory pathway predicted ATPase ExeA